MKNEIFEKVKEMSKNDLIEIISMFDACNTCSGINRMECKYHQLRHEMGISRCYGISALYDKVKKPDSEAESKIKRIYEIIEELENKLGKPIPIEEITAVAESEEIKYEKVLEILVKLEREGHIFEPKNMFIQRI